MAAGCMAVLSFRSNTFEDFPINLQENNDTYPSQSKSNVDQRSGAPLQQTKVPNI